MKTWWSELNTGDKLPLIAVLVIAVAILLAAIIVEVRDIYWLSKDGVERIIVAKPLNPSLRELLWRLSELLIIPGTLVIIAYLLNQRLQERERRQREQEERLAKIQLEEIVLQNYIDRMTELLLQHELRKSETDSEICHVARTRTLTVLRGLTEERKSSVVRFLYEARLISSECRLVQLEQADLRRVKLRNAQLPGIDLRGVRLNGSNLSGADLSGTDLTRAFLNSFVPEDRSGNPDEKNTQPTLLVKTNLNEASLTGADLRKGNLKRANLQDADLSGALLNEADLTNATVLNANLEGANLSGAYLSGANLSGANLAGSLLTGASYNTDTLWPESYDPVANGAEPVAHEHTNGETKS